MPNLTRKHSEAQIGMVCAGVSRRNDSKRERGLCLSVQSVACEIGLQATRLSFTGVQHRTAETSGRWLRYGFIDAATRALASAQALPASACERVGPRLHRVRFPRCPARVRNVILHSLSAFVQAVVCSHMHVVHVCDFVSGFAAVNSQRQLVVKLPSLRILQLLAFPDQVRSPVQRFQHNVILVSKL